MADARFSVPTPGGSIELAPGSGNCIVPGCRTRGGGMLELTAHDVEHDRSGRFVVCGKHFGLALAGLMEKAA